jgi:hypothetical protein
MKTTSILLSLVSALCLLVSCETTSVTVSTNHDPSANFAKYRTYTLAPPKAGQTMSPVAETALHDALRTELGARGITEAAANRADLNIVRHVFVQRKVSVQQYTAWGYGYGGGWPYGYGYYGMWPGAPMTYTDVTQYHEGTLVLDFVDARTKKLVFRGVGTAVVGDSEANAEKIREAVKKIVADYPVVSAQ